MTLRLTLALLALLSLSGSAQAGPIHFHRAAVSTANWLKRHPKTAKVLAASAAAGVHAYGLHRCRVEHFEVCDGKYGSAWAIFGMSTALNFTMIPVSQKLGGFEGDALSYGGSAIQFGHGVYQWQKGGEHAKKD
jgi:hypothetical protein